MGAALLLLAGLAACDLGVGHVSGTIRSQVVDAATGKPIAGTIVLGVWTTRAGIPGMAYSKLVGIQEAETDAEGRFALERPRGAYGGPDYESITVYKFGYVAWNNNIRFPNWVGRKESSVPSQIQLEPFPAGESHQRHLSFISSVRWAGMYGYESSRKFQNALEQELRMP